MESHTISTCESCGSRVHSTFAALTVVETAAVSSSKACHRYERGATVFRQDEFARGLYCIHHGHVKVSRTGHDGREQILRFAGPGEQIGYASLITGEPYTINAAAVESSSVCFIPRELIFNLIRENTHLALRFMQAISHELDDTERRVVELAQKSVRERVAEALLVLRETFGTDDDGETIRIQLTREEIADIVGTAPESVIRMLSELKHDQVIETAGRNIRIKNLRSLIQTANLAQ